MTPQFLRFEKLFSTQKIGFAWILALSMASWLFQSSLLAQENGSDDLDQAFDQKIKASSTRDLEAVVKLCKSAIEKGLNEEGVVQAKQLAASSSMEHAEQLTKRIFDQTPPDPRWQKFRSEALLKLKQAVEFQPDLVAAHLLMARLNLMPNGDIDAARAAVELAVQHAGEDRAQLSQALFFRASLSEDKEAKLADVNQALKINPKNIEALKFRAVYHLSNNDAEKGMADIRQWLSVDDIKPQDLLETTVLLRAMGSSFDDKLQLEALKIIDRGIEIAPEDFRFLEQRAAVFAIRKELDKAIADYTKLIEMDSAESKVWRPGFLLLRGQLYGEQEKFDEAIKDFDEILDVNPNLLDAIQARGFVLAAKGDFAGSIKEFKKIERRMNAPNPALMRQIANLYSANDEPSKALEIFNKLLELVAEEKFEDEPEDTKRVAELERQATWRFRGDAYLSLGQHKEAIEDYNRVLEIHQSNKEFAKQNSEQEIPEDDHSLNNLAWVLATSPVDELRDGKRAIELATQAAEATEHKEAHILSTLASAYAETGDFDNAIKWIDKAVEINAKARAEKEDEQNLKQKDSLQKEKEHYLRKEPFRELQNVEEEKAAKEAKAESKDGSKDGEEADGQTTEKGAEDKSKDGKKKGAGNSKSGERKKEMSKDDQSKSDKKSKDGADKPEAKSTDKKPADEKADKDESQEKKKSKKDDQSGDKDEPDKENSDDEEPDDEEDSDKDGNTISCLSI